MQQQPPQSQLGQPNPPNEQGVIHVQGFLRITDPQTQQVIVEQRA